METVPDTAKKGYREPDGSRVDPGIKAVIHAKKEMGVPTKKIAAAVPYCYNTVKAVLKQQEPDPILVDAILKREVAELAIAGGLARNNIIRRLADGQGNIIENTAVMDKTFIQRRLIGGQSTSNHLAYIATAERKHDEALDKLAALESAMKE